MHFFQLNSGPGLTVLPCILGRGTGRLPSRTPPVQPLPWGANTLGRRRNRSVRTPAAGRCQRRHLLRGRRLGNKTVLISNRRELQRPHPTRTDHGAALRGAGVEFYAFLGRFQLGIGIRGLNVGAILARRERNSLGV